jgi:hypothetical protein
MQRQLDPKFRAQLSLLQLQELEQVEAVCVGCGCTDLTPCNDDGMPCSWSFVDVHTGRGICSACVKLSLDELYAKATAREIRSGQRIQLGRLSI